MDLAVKIERDPALAKWLNVEEVALVREDQLPDGGGKKRRSLHHFAVGLQNITDLHILSYAGSHTAYTLAHLLPETKIHLYGNHYGGGAYEEAMVKKLNALPNVDQQIGTALRMSVAFYGQKRRPGHHFMKVGGSLGVDRESRGTAQAVADELGPDYLHILAVASGDLLQAVQQATPRVVGVLTQPPLIRLVKKLTLKSVVGIIPVSLKKRESLVREARALTGHTFDPIFMGSVLHYLKNNRPKGGKLCLWVTCPRDIHWLEENSGKPVVPAQGSKDTQIPNPT